MREIVVGSRVEYRKPGMAASKKGSVEWVYRDIDQQPFYRVRPDMGKRTKVYPEDIERAAKPKRASRR